MKSCQDGISVLHISFLGEGHQSQMETSFLCETLNFLQGPLHMLNLYFQFMIMLIINYGL